MYSQTLVDPIVGADTAKRGLRSLGSRLQEFAVVQLQTAEKQLARSGNARHLGIHEARKCMRRLRAVLALGKASLDTRAERLDQDLRRLGHGLSSLRDAQALVEALQRLEQVANPKLRATLPDAIKAAQQRRDRLLSNALLRDPDFAHRRRRLHAMRGVLGCLDWAGVEREVVEAALVRSEKRAATAGKRAHLERDDDEQWHRLRRRMRQLNQQDGILAELQPDLRSSVKDLGARANKLGKSQDDVLLLARCASRSPFTVEQRRLLREVARSRLGRVRHD